MALLVALFRSYSAYYYTQQTNYHHSCFYEVGGLKYIINHININISQQGNTSATPLWPPTW